MELEFHYQIHKYLPTVPILTHINPFQIPQTYISNIPGLGPRPVLGGGGTCGGKCGKGTDFSPSTSVSTVSTITSFPHNLRN